MTKGVSIIVAFIIILTVASIAVEARAISLRNTHMTSHRMISKRDIGRISSSGVIVQHDLLTCVDANGDAHVNVLDFGAFMNRFAARDTYGDFNGDQFYNALDFDLFRSRFEALDCSACGYTCVQP